MRPSNHKQAKQRTGRWSLALKQGVVLKLARFVVVPWGLNWLEWAQSHTYHSWPLTFTHLSPASSLQIFPRWLPVRLSAFVGFLVEVLDIWGQLEATTHRIAFHVPGFHLITLTGVASVGSSGFSAACTGCAAAFLSNRSECWGLVLSGWVTSYYYNIKFSDHLCLCCSCENVSMHHG